MRRINFFIVEWHSIEYWRVWKRKWQISIPVLSPLCTVTQLKRISLLWTWDFEKTCQSVLQVVWHGWMHSESGCCHSSKVVIRDLIMPRVSELRGREGSRAIIGQMKLAFPRIKLHPMLGSALLLFQNGTNYLATGDVIDRPRSSRPRGNTLGNNTPGRPVYYTICPF